MNTKEELQKFNDVVLISKKKYISLANSEGSIESQTSANNADPSTLKGTEPFIKEDQITDQIKKSIRLSRMPNIKVFSGKHMPD